MDSEPQPRIDREEAKWLARREELERAERPVVEDLQAAGIPVDSAWNLYDYPEMGEVAYPILLNHLSQDYPDRILEGIARAFTKDVVRRHWRELLDLYLQESRPDAMDGLAATLSRYAVRDHYEDLLAILRNEALGETRIYFLRPVNRIGNRIKTGQGRAVIGSLEHDPVLGKEATAILTGRSRSQ